VTGRATIIGILVLAQRPLRATQLIRLAAPVGMRASNVKSHLTRMVREGSLKRQGPARLATYEPSARQAIVVAGIDARLSLQATSDWDSTWYMLALGLPRNRARREQMRAELWFDGFRPIGREVFVRPAWPLPWASERVRGYLARCSGHCVRGEFAGKGLAPDEVYDLDGLDREGHRIGTWLASRERNIASPRAAYVARMEAGERVARFIGHDPHLPQAIWGKRRGVRELVEAFWEFEKILAPVARRFVGPESWPKSGSADE
jgi:DNA-binding transcriptional regulator PaaX